MIKASCRCGQLTFRISQEPIFQAFCHCTDCRSISNSPFVETAFFPSAAVERVGSPKSFEFIGGRGTATFRDVCPECGDLLADRSAAFPDLIGLLVNKIQPTVSSKSRFHMWVSSAVDEVQPDDGLAKFEFSPPARGEKR